MSRGVFDHGLFDCEFHDVFGEHVAKQTCLAERGVDTAGGGNATKHGPVTQKSAKKEQM